ncbi:MAG: glycosyltransferase family 2 protein [bacterium]
MSVVSYLLVAYKSRAQIGATLTAIKAQRGDFEREVIVVENYPQESCAEIVFQALPEARLIVNSRNEGFTRALNQALHNATGDFHFVLNPDVELGPHCTETLLKVLSEPETWAAAPQLRFAGGEVQFSVRNFPTFLTLIWEFSGLSRLFPNSSVFGRWRNQRFDHRSRALVEQPMASAFLMRREVFDKLGDWDERFFIFFSDVDYCKRIAAVGGKIIFAPAATATHQVGGSTRQEGNWLIYESHRSFYRYLAKHELVGIRYLLRPAAMLLLSLGAIGRALCRKLTGRLF